MKNRLIKISSIILIAVLLICTVPTLVLSFTIDPQIQRVYRKNGEQERKSYHTLSEAVNAMCDGDTITIADEVLSYTTSDGVEIDKKVTFMTGEHSLSGTMRYVRYTGSSPLFTVKDGGVLTLQYALFNMESGSSPAHGKLIRVEKGGTLIIDGTSEKQVTFNNSSNGLISVEDGGRVIFYGARFNGNQSDGDIYVENGGAVIGDLNGDRTIDIRDLVRAKKYLASPDTVTTVNSLDYDRDGNKNGNDLTILRQYLLEVG